MPVPKVRRVLLFEPNDEVRGVLVQLFRSVGMRVIACSTLDDVTAAKPCDVGIVAIQGTEHDAAIVARVLLARAKVRRVSFFSNKQIRAAVKACNVILTDVRIMLDRVDADS